MQTVVVSLLPVGGYPLGKQLLYLVFEEDRIVLYLLTTRVDIRPLVAR